MIRCALLTSGVMLFMSLGLGGQVPVVPDTTELRKPFSAEDIDNFMQPPKINYPQTWFHVIGGNISKEGLTADLEAIAASGISGVQFFHGQAGGPWPGVEPQITALSKDWDTVVKHAAVEAKRLGLRFTMLLCSGWATAGGPWIEPSNAMRHLVYSREDIRRSDSLTVLPVPQPSGEPWRDYQDIAVLAFPTPLDDSLSFLKPVSVESNVDFDWTSLVAGTNRSPVSLPPCRPSENTVLEITFPEKVSVRTIELPSMNSINHPFCYEPGITVTVEAYDGNTPVVMMHGKVPSSNFQDNTPISFACSDGIKTDRYRVTIHNEHHMTLWSLKLYTAARKNCWQSEAGWTLRNLERDNASPDQDARAYIAIGNILDISERMGADGTLDWTPPDGRSWSVMRIGHVNTGRQNYPAPPEGTGWECNKLDSTGAQVQFDSYLGRLLNGALSGGLLDGMLMDSWEAETQTWTGNMEKEFSDRNDYALRKWIPAVFGYVIEDQETTARFLRDWRRTVSDMMVEHFYGTLSENARNNGLTFTYETSQGDCVPGDILEYFKYADVPMCEFWHPFSDGYVGSINFKPIRPAASAAHLYGKPRLAAESFTSFSHTWDEHWDMLKEIADYHFAEGVTHIVYHTYTHNPEQPFLPPGTSFGGAGIGTPFLRGQTWWKYMPEINTYFARCSYMQERGRPVADILWFIGDELEGKPDQYPDFLRGYKSDYCNPDILMNRISVKNGKLVTPEGLEYSVLWLPGNCRMVPETLSRIYRLIQDGATVVGAAPETIASLNGGERARKEFDRLVGKIWGKKDAGIRKIGKGRLIQTENIEAALGILGIEPDLSGKVMWNHRRTDGADWYFVCPDREEAFAGELDFRCSGEVEIWDPATGKRRRVHASYADGRTSVPIELPESGSCYVVFRNSSDLSFPELTRAESVTQLDGWRLSFPSGWGIEGDVMTDTLKPWKDMELSEEGKAFSGTVTYETTFDIDTLADSDRFMLDLGKVDMIAAVSVNGSREDVIWAPPYSLDITENVRQGANTVRVDVTGTWFNRLVYDAAQAPETRKTWVIRWPSKDEPLRDSGLLGPVKVTRSAVIE